MKIERTFIRNDVWMSYCITDNICSICKHNPENKNPWMGCDGKCKECRESVVECINFSKM